MNRGIYVGGIYPDGGIYNVSQQGVVIDGKNYNTKKIGNLIWTIENLDINTSGSETRSSHPEFGRYCPFEDLTEIESVLSKGWRIPSKADFQKLADACNSDVKASQSTGYSLWPKATNLSKFGAVPNRNSSSSEAQLDRSILWTSTITLSEFICFFIGTSSFTFNPFGFSENLKVCSRACKSVGPKNLFKKSEASLLAGYCGTVGANFIIDANNGSQKSLVIPITNEMKGKILRFSCALGDDVSNRWVCGQVDEIPSSGRMTYGSENTLFLASQRQNGHRSFADSSIAIGNYNYIVFFFDSGLADTSKFIDSLMICDDGNYYPYVSGT